MHGQDYEQLTLFQEDSPVSPSLKPGSWEARAMTVSSGRRCCALSKSCTPLGWLERMLLTSSIWHSTMCFLTWRPRATKRGRLWFQLAASALCTYENGLQSWPTPTATDASPHLARHPRKDATDTRSVMLCQKVQRLAGGGAGDLNPEWVEWLMGFPIGWTECDALETP